MHRIDGPYDSAFVKPVERKRDEMEGNHQLLPRTIFPMIRETRWGRVWWSERRLFQLDRLSRDRSFFNEQVGEPSEAGSPVPVGTAGDVTLVVELGLRVLDDEMLVLVPLSLPPPEDATSLAMGPPGKT